MPFARVWHKTECLFRDGVGRSPVRRRPVNRRRAGEPPRGRESRKPNFRLTSFSKYQQFANDRAGGPDPLAWKRFTLFAVASAKQRTASRIAQIDLQFRPCPFCWSV